MPRFRYKAVSATGELVEGEMETDSRSAAIAALRAQGLLPIRAEAAGGLLPQRRGAPGERLTALERRLFTRELATLLEAGLPLDRALSLIAEVSQESKAVAALARHLLQRLRGGSGLADALAESGGFPRDYLGVLRAGEAGGEPERALKALAVLLGRRQALLNDIRAALRYPLFVLMASGVSLVLLLTLVVPEFAPLFAEAGRDLPLSTELLLALSLGLKKYWWLLFLAAALAALAIGLALSRPGARRRLDALALELPLIGRLLREVETARFARTLATLLRNGVPAAGALGLTAGALSNGELAGRIAEAEAKLKKGEGFARPLTGLGIFPPLATQLMAVGEESGRIEEMLEHIADLYDEEVRRRVERLLALLVPGVTAGLGLLVAAIIGSILAAILGSYDLAL